MVALLRHFTRIWRNQIPFLCTLDTGPRWAPAQGGRAQSRNLKPHAWGRARPGWRGLSCGRDAGRLGVVGGESSPISSTEQCSTTSSWSLLRAPSRGRQRGASRCQRSFWPLTADARGVNPWVRGDVRATAFFGHDGRIWCLQNSSLWPRDRNRSPAFDFNDRCFSVWSICCANPHFRLTLRLML